MHGLRSFTHCVLNYSFKCICYSLTCLSDQGRSCVRRQCWPGGWPTNWICPRVLWLHVHIWRLPEVPKLYCGVLCRETSHCEPIETGEAENSYGGMLPHHRSSSNQNHRQRRGGSKRKGETETFRCITEREWTWECLHPDQYLHISHQVMCSIWGLMIPSLSLCHCLSNSHTTTKSERAREQLSPQEDCQTCCKCHHFLSCSDAVLLTQVYNWPVGPKGLLHDRSWMVVNRNGVCLSQKRESRLCLIQPQVHLSSNRLLLQASGQIMFQQLIEKHTSACPVLERFLVFFLCFLCRPTGMDAISVPLKNTANVHSGYEVCQSKVCGDRCADLCTKLL